MTYCTRPRSVRIRFITVAVLLIAVGVDAQSRPAAPARPASQPTSRTTPLHVSTPIGFVRIDLDGRSFLTLPADEAWVRRAAGQINRPTPTTQASDITANLSSKRELIVAEVLKDLPSLTPSKVEKTIADLVPVLQQIQTIRPAMVYVVSPSEHIKQALRDGWSDSRFRYNQASDAIEYDRTVSLQPDGGSDESAVAAFFSPADAESQRVSALGRYVKDTEQQIQQQVTSRAVTAVLDRFRVLVATEALADLPKREDQDWLVTGLANVLAAKYAAKVHGAPLAEFVQAMINAPQDAVFNAARIDLLHPLSATQLKDEMVMPYLEAKRRKSIAVVYVWMDRAGEGKVSQLVDSISRLRPADGASLVAAVKSSSDVDLAIELAPQ